MDAVALEERDRHRFILGRRLTYGLAAVCGALSFAFGDVMSAMLTTAMAFALAVVAHIASRDGGLAPNDPADASKMLRRRARARLRLGRVVRVATVLFAATSIALAAVRREALVGCIITAFVTCAFVWIASYAIERRIRRALAAV